MSLLKFLFPRLAKPSDPPAVAFGRFSDSYKTEAQQAAWNKSLQLFEDGRTLDAYREMLVFLYDEKTNNIQWREDEKGLHFTLRQGSRSIQGHANRDFIKVESRILWATDLQVGVMRRLVEQNFKLRYARYALTPDNALAIVFDSSTRDGSPYKVVQAMVELSVNADKQDDLLLEEFKNLRPVEEAMIMLPLPEAEQAAKVKYIRQQIDMVMAALERAQPDPNRFPGGYVYLLLGTAFRIDYLVRPEGFTMDILEKIFRSFFSNDEKSPVLKVEAMRKLYRRIADRSDNELRAELYGTCSTFGVNPAVGHDRIQSILDAELPKMDWHVSQKHPEEIQLAIIHYAVGYVMYHCSPPLPDRDFLQLVYRITEQKYFKELGFQDNFFQSDGQLKKNIIEDEIRSIAHQWANRYRRLKPDLSRLNYTSLPMFGQSYLRMVRDLDLS